MEKLFIIRWYIHLMHHIGLVSLSNFYREPWKNRLHRFYSLAVVTLVQMHAVSICLALFVFAIRDLSEFCERFFETLVVVTCVLDTLYIRWYLTQFLALLDEFGSFARYYERHPKLVKMRRIQWKVVWILITLLALENTINILLPFIPKSPENLDRLKRIYKIGHPENTFIIAMYIPSVDTSAPMTYRLLFPLVIYVYFLYTFIFVLSIFFYPVLVFELKVYTDILCEYLQLLGQEHRNKEGRLIFYTNLAKNTSMSRSLPDPAKKGSETHLEEEEKAIQYVFARNLDIYEYFYLSQVILLQKKLLHMRLMLDKFYHNAFMFRGSLSIAMLLISVIGTLSPGLLSLLPRIKCLTEAVIMLLTYYVHFYCGELLSDCNVCLRRAAWFSSWYRCSIRTQRGFIILLRITQKLNYFTISGLCDMNYTLMIKTFRAAYSFFNVMNLTRKRGFK